MLQHAVDKQHMRSRIMNANEDYEEFDGGFSVNYDSIIKEKSLLSVTRLLAADLARTPYMSIGDFFKNTSDADVQQLVTVIEAGEQHENFGDLMLISMMLAAAEGCEGSNLDEYAIHVNQFSGFVIIESLSRKGLVQAFRENMSFGDDYKHAIIVKRLDD